MDELPTLKVPMYTPKYRPPRKIKYSMNKSRKNLEKVPPVYNPAMVYNPEIPYLPYMLDATPSSVEIDSSKTIILRLFGIKSYQRVKVPEYQIGKDVLLRSLVIKYCNITKAKSVVIRINGNPYSLTDETPASFGIEKNGDYMDLFYRRCRNICSVWFFMFAFKDEIVS